MTSQNDQKMTITRKIKSKKSEILFFFLFSRFRIFHVNLTIKKKTFLSVTIDNISFVHHVNCIKNKTAKTTEILYKIIKFLSHDAELNYYLSLVYPHLSYNIIVWGGTNPTHSQPYIIKRKLSSRLISGVSYSY